eukprot:981185_1
MAACVYSQNNELTSLIISADVCHASGDLINQVPAVKRILELMEVNHDQDHDQDQDQDQEEGSLSKDDEEIVDERQKMRLRLNQLEQDLQDMMTQ